MKKIKVLFIDDDLNLGRIVTIALEEEGYEVHFQNSLAAAKAVVNSLRPDILILDVEIGKDDGIDIVPELRAAVPDIPIIFVSSHIESTEVERALKAGAIAYLKKPFEITELAAYIDRHAKNTHEAGVKIGSLFLNAKGHTLLQDQKVVKRLSFLEFRLLNLLACNLNDLVTHEQIEQGVWKEGYMSEHSRNNCIAKLRKYLSVDKDIKLLTDPKIGYKLMVTK